MLENVILDTDVNKDQIKNTLKSEVKRLGERLSVLQQEIKRNNIPVIVLFEGWGAAGKGSLIGKTILNLDPRGSSMFNTTKPTQEELRKPFMNRFWCDIPQNGEIAFFDRGWYFEYSKKNKESINIFERQLRDNGYLVIKIFLHITKEEQRARFDRLLASKNTAWRVTDKDLKENKNYDKSYKKYDEMLEETNTEYAPWNVISGMYKTEAMHEILSIIVENIEARIKSNDGDGIGIRPEDMQHELVDMPKLKDVDLAICSMEEDEYRKTLKKLQKKLGRLAYRLYKKRIPLIICYEGWDAAGKGGNIKRVAASLDPRDYEVTPIAAPVSYEKNRHFLWRFQNRLPKTGHIAIFDRTWYGRVMVERLEGFCSENSWKRAYNEINEFEAELNEWGAVVVKFWLQIDKDEQLKRFTDRQNTPEKQWKITDEDWRNREKWDKYEVAVNQMIKYTSTRKCPWTIIESNSKYYARIKALETIIAAVEKKLAE